MITLPSKMNMPSDRKTEMNDFIRAMRSYKKMKEGFLYYNSLFNWWIATDRLIYSVAGDYMENTHLIHYKLETL